MIRRRRCSGTHRSATDRVKLCSSANRANCALVHWQPRSACRVTHRASPRPSQPEVTRSVRMFVNGPPRAAIRPRTDTASIARYADRCSGAPGASRWPRRRAPLRQDGHTASMLKTIPPRVIPKIPPLRVMPQRRPPRVLQRRPTVFGELALLGGSKSCWDERFPASPARAYQPTANTSAGRACLRASNIRALSHFHVRISNRSGHLQAGFVAPQRQHPYSLMRRRRNI